MSLSIKAERALVTHDEFEMLAQTHHPALHSISDHALSEAQGRIRDLRAKERTFARDLRRSIRGKGGQRGGSFPGNVDKPARRKQVFASALKRVNGEISRRRAVAARDALKDAARRAIGLKNAARSHRAPAYRTSRAGMRRIENERTRNTVQPAKVGSVSQATKNAQAARDARE
ncbi:MAG: hypothetical protein MIN69_04235 [Methylorubrum extorquens]|jgi:hypothetical protein|uniref:hypothetical protein n=1 Tax=Methylorubrum extorquens TaxID=408 RepID=UPI002FEE33D5